MLKQQVLREPGSFAAQLLAPLAPAALPPPRLPLRQRRPDAYMLPAMAMPPRAVPRPPAYAPRPPYAPVPGRRAVVRPCPSLASGYGAPPTVRVGPAATAAAGSKVRASRLRAAAVAAIRVRRSAARSRRPVQQRAPAGPLSERRQGPMVWMHFSPPSASSGSLRHIRSDRGSPSRPAARLLGEPPHHLSGEDATCSPHTVTTVSRSWRLCYNRVGKSASGVRH